MKNVINSSRPTSLKTSKENISKSNPRIIKNTYNSPTLQEEIENLKSVYYQLEFLNLKLINTFAKQKISAEEIFLEKIDEIIRFREINFNLISQINGMKNISKIEEYLGSVHSKIYLIESKIANVLENIEDFKLNVNYGLDRLYLEDNIVCDENSLIKNFESATNSLNGVIGVNQNKFREIESLKKNYLEFINLLNEENEKILKIKILLQNSKTEVLENTTDKILDKLNQENESLEKNLFN